MAVAAAVVAAVPDEAREVDVRVEAADVERPRRGRPGPGSRGHDRRDVVRARWRRARCPCRAPSGDQRSTHRTSSCAIAARERGGGQRHRERGRLAHGGVEERAARPREVGARCGPSRRGRASGRRRCSRRPPAPRRSSAPRSAGNMRYAGRYGPDPADERQRGDRRRARRVDLDEVRVVRQVEERVAPAARRRRASRAAPARGTARCASSSRSAPRARRDVAVTPRADRTARSGA